ncbi:hypothetical protein HPB49_007104 [Dermacentor silvarum]|uniref:Uncharacterized protein n=1 Tax=Dermacentor silvarum TaxID=543639 RepID=A0ACB8D3R1_DERSI|nr:hypothetical protein HPB49_007104 [Dermacentor silvarum]
MGFMHETFEQFKKGVIELRREVTEVKTQNSQCQYDIKQMQKALVEAKQEIIELKQYSRSQNVEIKGIPVLPDENLRKSVVKMATFVGVNISEDDIDVVHRVRSKDKDRPNVVLRFCTRAVRDKFFSAARKAKLTTRALGFE